MTEANDVVEVTEADRVALENLTPGIVAYFASDTCLIWSDEHRLYWRPGGNGYTSDTAKAGVWTLSDAYARTKHCDPSKGIVFVRAPPASEGDREAVGDIVVMLRGRARFCRNRGEIKTPELLEEAALIIETNRAAG